jgi:ferritin-like protein
MTKPNHHNIPTSDTESVSQKWQRVVGRRSFLHGVGVAGATLAATTLAAQGSNKLPPGDVAILRFLAAAELIESDLWSQYAELGGANGGNPAYKLALQNLDGDMPQYITDNTDDELSHAAFLNAYLMSKGAQPVNLDMFRTLPSTIATGAKQVKRLTNLQQLDVDTSYYTRYRSDLNPDLGAMFPDVVSIKNQPAIPISDADTPPGQAQPVPPTTTQQTRMQAIANSAAFHFGFIEQGGSSLYPTMALKATDLEVLRIVLSIGGVEIDHFSLWHDKLGNAISQPLAGVVDPETGTAFPDLNNPMNQPFGNDLAQTNLILPEPCQFINPNLPLCSVIRPISTENSGAMAAVKALTADNLFNFTLQPGFFDTLMELAAAADAAMRQSGHN